MDECLNNHTRDLCLGFQNTIQVVTNSRELRERASGIWYKQFFTASHMVCGKCQNLLKIACTWQALVMLTAIMHPVGDTLQSCSA